MANAPNLVTSVGWTARAFAVFAISPNDAGTQPFRATASRHSTLINADNTSFYSQNPPPYLSSPAALNSRRRQADGHRNPSLQTHASAKACWQVRARIPRPDLHTQRKARPHLR